MIWHVDVKFWHLGGNPFSGMPARNFGMSAETLFFAGRRGLFCMSAEI